ncbi:MAG: peroxiredoxin-like family protein [Polyangiales bacterium]
MHLLFRLLLVVPLLSACDPPTPPSAPAFAASSPKPVTVTASGALGTREDGLGLAIGAAIPPFEIQDFRGNTFSSAAMNDANTLVVFYRGGWCPYCNFQIRELSRSYERFKALGVSLVAISVDRPDAAAVTQNAYEVPFPVLSDPDLRAHEAFNVVLQLDAAGVARLAKYGHDIEQWSGKDHHKMAVPAVFVVRDGKVAWTHVARDYKTRPSTEQLLTAVKP